MSSLYAQINAKRQLRRSVLSSFVIIGITIALCAILVLLFFPIEKINTDNMSGRLDNNDIVLCMKQPAYAVGDLVVISYGDFTLVKRIVALSGDYVDFDNENHLLVNDVLVDEWYILNSRVGDYENVYPRQVSDESYFVLSDNREVMSDSRSGYIGDVKQDIIVGRVLFRFWPFDKISII